MKRLWHIFISGVSHPDEFTQRQTGLLVVSMEGNFSARAYPVTILVPAGVERILGSVIMIKSYSRRAILPVCACSRSGSMHMHTGIPELSLHSCERSSFRVVSLIVAVNSAQC